MSKIQEALKRIQSSKQALTPEKFGKVSSDDSLILAKIVDNGVDESAPSAISKCLHLDRDALRDAGLIAPEVHEKLLGNQYRDIKRPLIAHAFGKRATRVKDGNLIMVTSAVPGEGKTFTSINLALSMSQERDHEVLLVDADVAKPHTSDMFGASGEKGLLDLLEDLHIPVETLILPTDVKGLKILPAGRPRHHATELLASSKMEKVMSILANLSPGQIVIFDSPPLLLTSEAKILTTLVGQVVVVIRAEETPQEAILAALSLLDEQQAVNLVLNQVRAGFTQYQYGYGYGYGQSENNAGEQK